MVMQRQDPFRDLQQMDGTINRLWRDLGNARPAREDWNIAPDVVQQDDEIVVKATVPGIKPDEIDPAIEDNILIIQAERKADFEDGESV